MKVDSIEDFWRFAATSSWKVIEAAYKATLSLMEENQKLKQQTKDNSNVYEIDDGDRHVVLQRGLPCSVLLNMGRCCNLITDHTGDHLYVTLQELGFLVAVPVGTTGGKMVGK